METQASHWLAENGRLPDESERKYMECHMGHSNRGEVVVTFPDGSRLIEKNVEPIVED